VRILPGNWPISWLPAKKLFDFNNASKIFSSGTEEKGVAPMAQISHKVMP